MEDNYISKLQELLEKFKLPIALSLVGVVLVIGGLFSSQNKSFSNKEKNLPEKSLVETQKLITVDVSGEVVRNGVYQLKEGSRIEDAIKIAGGFSKTASSEYISKQLNMAQKVTDGSKIYIPKIGEQVNQQVAGTSTTIKINLNTGSQSELESLPGIGPVTASKIISMRPYQDIEELISKKVVGKAVFEKIKDSLVLN